jgi:peptide/nickel transport system ATP-binding protein
MYAGQIVEEAPVRELFRSPKHPYTRGLLDSIPKKGISKDQALPTIDGMVPDISSFASHCRFAERCKYAQDKCFQDAPKLEHETDRSYACFYPLTENR